MDDSDFDLLTEGMPPEQAKRMRKIMVEWCDGDENGFPVQMAMLTRMQWHIAAGVPRSVNESRKLLEAHSAEHLRQFKALLPEFAGIARNNTEELKAVVANHATTAKQVTETIRAKIRDAEAVAERTKDLMENATTEWQGIKATVVIQCERLQQISNELQDRFAWQVILRTATWFVLALALGMFIDHYWIR